jgi:predicted type IV restriction endonuclease
MITQSEADSAYIKFRHLVESHKIFRYDDPRLSEADTRAKLIDPVFKDVLNWSESEIRREKPSTTGFADYLLGSDAAYVLIEAKRTNPRFRLEAPSKPRKLQLEGPHLLGQKKMRAPLEQAQRYASDLGAQFALLANGSQIILFRPYLPGRAWTAGIAIVFHDHDDVVQDFAYFFRLLAREQVVSGALLDAFEEAEGITQTVYAPAIFLEDIDAELIRNPFWTNLSRVMVPLLTDEPENLELRMR